jgi:hypothetical protein
MNITPADSGAASAIHCIGDSHVCFFSGHDTIHRGWPVESETRLSWFRTYRIGSALAYNLSRSGTTTRGRERLFEVLETKVPPGARVLLVFGEIDCRAHLVKQSKSKGLPIETVVELCLDEYFKAVREVVARGFRVIVYNVVPSRSSMQGKLIADGETLPTTGTWRERNRATRLFNDGARRRCVGCGAAFLENYSHLVDGDGKTVGWYFWDSIHLSQRAMPATLENLRALCPDLGIPPQMVMHPGRCDLIMDVVRRRFGRLFKDAGKIFQIFGAS